ncbi:hypothetical protein VNO78_12034 [Psophocarpus tetragonolobus]|uniref:Cytochrome P450 n=1 Tax=Psophocarpus tetragonolobus TaxID=3891 RepID=A0AAN9SN96_PSOTE
MEAWFMIVVSVCVCVLIRGILFCLHTKTKTFPNPPGPLHIPFISSFLWLPKSFSELEPILRPLLAKHGPIFTVHIGPRPAIFIADRALAHQALVQNGAVFSDRPVLLPLIKARKRIKERGLLNDDVVGFAVA